MVNVDTCDAVKNVTACHLRKRGVSGIQVYFDACCI